MYLYLFMYTYTQPYSNIYNVLHRYTSKGRDFYNSFNIINAYKIGYTGKCTFNYSYIIHTLFNTFIIHIIHIHEFNMNMFVTKFTKLFYCVVCIRIRSIWILQNIHSFNLKISRQLFKCMKILITELSWIIQRLRNKILGKKL